MHRNGQTPRGRGPATKAQESLKTQSRTSDRRFADSFPNNIPCDCEFCRHLSIKCSFAQQRVRQRQQELEALSRLEPQKEKKAEGNRKRKESNETDEKDWRARLQEDSDYCKTIGDLEAKIEEHRKTEEEMCQRKKEKKFTKHLGLVKEYRKWSNDVYAPKTNEIFRKSDEKGDDGKSQLANGYAGFLAYDAMIRQHGVYPHDRVFLDRWKREEYDPWDVAKESILQTTSFSGSLDPLSLQQRQFLEEARGLYLLGGGYSAGSKPNLGSMKPWLRMPYSYYAWQNSAPWSKHWKGVEEKLPEVPSVCASLQTVENDGDKEELANAK